MLAVKCTELLAVQAPDGPAGTLANAEQLAAGVPAEQWIACSAGHGAKGRRLLVALVWTTPVQPGLVLAWSRWRRRHQDRARRAHYQRREPQR